MKIAFASILLASYVGITVFICVTLWQRPGILIEPAQPSEYMIALSSPSEARKVIATVKVGLNKTQAEGAAFQLNETFTDQHIPLKATARPLIDIGVYHQK